MTDIQISLGVLAYRAGDFAEARRRWEAALRIDGKNDYARLLLTRLPTLEKFDRGGPQTADHRPQTYGREGDRTPR
jgi:Tfp pilus assembly protein PilF